MLRTYMDSVALGVLRTDVEGIIASASLGSLIAG